MEVFTMSYQFYYNRLIEDLSRDESDHRNKWAKETIAHVKADMARGDITIDSEGVVRNCIGRCLMEDLLAVAVYVNPSISAENTQRARNIEDEALLSEYRKMRATQGYSEEELAEMANAFGNSTVVDVLTGRSIH
jgi:hypothetical protein